jgi:hypothetical protein
VSQSGAAEWAAERELVVLVVLVVAAAVAASAMVSLWP